MKIFKPEESISKITSLIKNAKKYVVIVSPYNNLAGWDELIKSINDAGKMLNVSYYVRKDEGKTGIEDINVKIYEVPLLHAKMFFSESEAIISSGNLTNRPDVNWTILLDKKDEYDQIVGFFEKYIKPGAILL